MDDDATSVGQESAISGASRSDGGVSKVAATAGGGRSADDGESLEDLAEAVRDEAQQAEQEEEEEVKPALDISTLRPVTFAEMMEHNHGKSLWLAVDGLVRDVTSLLGFHPGGKEVLLNAAAEDASDKFHTSHMGPSFTIATAMFRNMPLIGRLDDSAGMLPGAVESSEGGDTEARRPPVVPGLALVMLPATHPSG
eukprot:scaffold41002_cov35-Prasinocladus_malaysianus.AAC.1